MSKTYDLRVKTGSYTAADGTVKGRYKTVGSVMEGDLGPFILLSRTFNPAGISVDEDRDSIIISMMPTQAVFEDDIPAPAGKTFKAGDQIPF